MIQGAYQLRSEARVHVFDAADLPWQATPEAGLWLKPVRYDNAQGLFLGLVRFDAMARSGLHQHRGVATSLVLEGGLTDYHGPIGLHQVGINLHGATHDAIAYAPTLLVSRLEGPVAYPKERSQLTGLHAGSHHDDIVNPAPERPPDFNIDIDALTHWHTGVSGLVRQLIFDYAGTSAAHRFVQLRLQPGLRCAAWRASALTEFWVRGGVVLVNGQAVRGNSFVVAEVGAELDIQSPHGALLLAWADGPEQWLQPPVEGTPPPSLFGF
jgi:ChrR Cupin-like domain